MISRCLSIQLEPTNFSLRRDFAIAEACKAAHQAATTIV